MTDEQLAALANGLVPYVRECVADAFKLSPELNEQVASAIRLLHESPPAVIIERAAPRAPRIARIEKDEAGNLVPVYEAQP